MDVVEDIVDMATSHSESKFIEEDKYGIQLIPSVATIHMMIFDGLEDEVFQTRITDIVVERAHLLLENRVFTDFLNLNDANMLTGLQQAEQIIEELEQMQPLQPKGLEFPTVFPLGGIYTVFHNGGPKINLSQKTDLVARVAEELQDNLEAYNEVTKRQMFRLRAEMEEYDLTIKETSEARATFEKSVMIEGLDPITQRIPAEKFIWFMQDWLKTKSTLTEKLRLRNSAMSSYYARLKVTAAQKKELGSCIHEVDYEQLVIENMHILRKCEKKNHHLEKLKKLTGEGHLELCKAKNYLQTLSDAEKCGKTTMAQIQQDVLTLTESVEVTTHELETARTNHQNVKYLTENYKVPSIVEYVRVKAYLDDMYKVVKILDRKIYITNIILKSTILQMKRLLSVRKTDPSWFIMQTQEDDELDIDYCKKLSICPDQTNPCDIYEIIDISKKHATQHGSIF